MENFYISLGDLLILQQQQHRHDERNHSDIATLGKADRLKHYGLHFAKYVGRLSRDLDGKHSIEKTIVDTALISLSAANALHVRLDQIEKSPKHNLTEIELLLEFAEAAEKGNLWISEPQFKEPADGLVPQIVEVQVR